ncbi:MAG: hypothetical protein HEQ40_06965 [Lacibacter sp.]|jgi:hypothetical protein
MKKAALSIPFLLQYKYRAYDGVRHQSPGQVQTTRGYLQQEGETTLLSFTLEHPTTKLKISVVHDLSSREIDLDHFITEERLIELAEDDYVFKGNYVRFLKTGGSETWELAARIKGSLDKENLYVISCPAMYPLIP